MGLHDLQHLIMHLCNLTRFTLDALRERNGRFLRLNLSSSTFCLFGVLSILLFLVLIFLLCLIIHVHSRYTWVFLIIDILLFIQKKKKLHLFDTEVLNCQ